MQCDQQQLMKTINITIINMDKISRKTIKAICLLTNSLPNINSNQPHSSLVFHRTILWISKPIKCSITDKQVSNMSHLVYRCSNHYNNNNNNNNNNNTNSNNNNNSRSCNNSHNKLADCNLNLSIEEPSATVKKQSKKEI